jgi:methyltransferase
MSGTLFGVDSRVAFTVLVGVVALQRLWELRASNRNVAALVRRGAFEVGAGHYPWMVGLHSAFLVSCVAEVWGLRRPFVEPIALVSMTALTAALALRWWTLRTLGDRWTTRIVVVPGETLVSSGPYRWLRHPNYVAVVLEIAAIPMLHCGWLTAAVFTIANLVLLNVRIRCEERALRDAGAAASGRRAA